MIRRTHLIVIGASWLALFLGACSREPLTGPPVVRVGRDQCAECGMLISEDRFCSGMLVDDAGRRTYVLFDDVGCMLDLEREGLAGRSVLERYVRDHATKEWVKAESARFLLADPQAFPTPMGTGIASFASPDAAARAQSTYPGQVLDYPGLAAARQAWTEARRNRPGG